MTLSLEGDLDLANLRASCLVCDDREVLLDGSPNVLQGLGLSLALGPAARKTWNGRRYALFRMLQHYLVLHRLPQLSH